MELVGSSEEMFPWQTPFSCTLPNDVMDPEDTIPYLDAMLVDIELPEISLEPEQAAPASHPKPLSISLWPPDPVSIRLSPSLSTRTIPVVSPAIQAPASIRTPIVVNTEPSSVQTGTRGFEVPAPAPTTGFCSAPNTPPEGKPKRSRGRGLVQPKCPRPPKKKKSLGEELGRGAAGPKSKENRLPTTAEHILRERQRRDDMSAKYLILESLLPAAPKRERAVVVEDAISFVGALRRKKARLLNRLADLKFMASSDQSPRSTETRSLALLPVLNPFECIVAKQRSAPQNCKSQSLGVLVRADPEIDTSAGIISAIRVHMGEQEVVVEMVWNKPRPDFQSALLLAVQSLGFDVTQCSILRLGRGCIQCVVTCSKSQALSQRISEIQSSSTLIIRALRNTLTRS